MESSGELAQKIGDVIEFPHQVESETEIQRAEARLLELGFEIEDGNVVKIPELEYLVRGGLTEKLRDIRVDFEDERTGHPVIRFKRGDREVEEALPVTSRWFVNPNK